MIDREDFVPDQNHRDRVIRNTAKDVARAKMMAAVLDARIAGESFQRIASRYGKGKPWAFKMVKAAQKEVWFEKAQTLCDLEMARLDKMQRGLWKRATEGDMTDIDAIKAILLIMDRRKAWEETIMKRRDLRKSTAIVTLSPEKRAYLEGIIRDAELRYDNEIQGIQSLEGPDADGAGQPVDGDSDRGPDEVGLV